MRRRTWILLSISFVLLASLFLGIPVMAGIEHDPILEMGYPEVTSAAPYAALIISFSQTYPFLVLFLSAGTVSIHLLRRVYPWSRSIIQHRGRRRTQERAHSKTASVQFRYFPRFTTGQRIEHAVLGANFLVLLATGLPQMYYESWGHTILRSLETLVLFRQIHLLAGFALLTLSAFHLGNALVRIGRRQLSAAIFLSHRDVQAAIGYVLHAAFRGERPTAGKYRIEQKITYWVVFFSTGILIGSGILLALPDLAGRVFQVAPLMLARIIHGGESIATLFFILSWHMYHVLIDSPTFSIFSGRLNGQKMLRDHPEEYQRLMKGLLEPSPVPPQE